MLQSDPVSKGFPCRSILAVRVEKLAWDRPSFCLLAGSTSVKMFLPSHGTPRTEVLRC